MRQNAKTDVVKDFYKLMNNSDFGNDCRNNTDNYSFTALFYENKDLTFAEKYQIFFDRNISEFISSELLKRQIQEEFANKLAALDSQGEYYEKNSLEVQKMKELNSVFSMKKSRQKAHTKDLVKDIEEKIREEESDLKTKTRNEYDQCLVCSVKLLPVKKKRKTTTMSHLQLVFSAERYSCLQKSLWLVLSLICSKPFALQVKNQRNFQKMHS